MWRSERDAMSEAHELSALIGEVYDAALDAARWPATLEQVTRYASGVASALVSHDTASATGGFYFSWGDDPHYTRLYFEKYVKLNPTLPAISRLGVGEIRSISNVIPFDKYRRTRLYLEWAKPQGYGDALLAVLDRSATSVAHLTITHRDCDSPVSDDVRRRFRLIVPHIRRAVTIARTLELHKVDAAVLAEAVDALAAGVFLLADDGHIVRANTSARALLEAGEVVRVDRGGLVAVDVTARAALRDAVAAAANGDRGLGTKGLAIPLGGESAPHVAHVLPLTSGARRQARVAYAATVAVFIHRAALEGRTPIDVLAQHYKLTPAELRVLVAIVEVGGVPEVAPVLGISETTVKTHLRHLFEKTSTSRQSDLVRVVASFASPVNT
jgi:DNA-binding CsgD family transcriptional regulator/PAS domain-containing protein